jgi:hypothetical protein
MTRYQHQDHRRWEYAQPYDITNRPGHGQQRKPTGHIGFVRELGYHTLDDTEVSIEHTKQEAAVHRRDQSVYQAPLFIYDEKIKPKDERPERTGEAEENRGHNSAYKAQHENGLATDVI